MASSSLMAARSGWGGSPAHMRVLGPKLSPACAWLERVIAHACQRHGDVVTPEAKLTGASCVCSCPCCCALPKKLGVPKALLLCPKPPNAGALAAPNAGVLDRKLNADEVAPNAGVDAPPKPKAGALPAAPNAGADAAPKASVEAPPKLSAELLAAPKAGAEAAPNAGVLKLPKREGELAGAPGVAAEAPAKLKAGADAAAACHGLSLCLSNHAWQTQCDHHLPQTLGWMLQIVVLLECSLRQN